MNKLLWGYSGLGSVSAIAIWYLASRAGIDPAILFVGAVAGILLCAGMVDLDEPWWPIMVPLGLALVVSALADWFGAADWRQTFVVLGCALLSWPLCYRALGSYDEPFNVKVLGVPAFMAFAWFVNLGAWWGLGAASAMFALQAVIFYWPRLKKTTPRRA